MPRRCAVLHSTLFLLLITCTASVVDAATDPLKASRKCRKTIATETAKLVKTAQKLVDRCHGARVKGKPVGDCNTTSGADPNGALPKVGAKAAAKIDKTCATGEPVRDNFPGGAVAAAIAPGVGAAVEASAHGLQGAADLAASKAAQKCHAAVGKARSTIVDAIVKTAVKCQLGLDKAATTFGALDPACLGDATDVASKAAAKVQKACTPKAALPLTGADVGSCDPLPACVVTRATATGQGLATLAFSKASACGDGFLDAGEACPLLEGAPDAPALSATVDMEVGAGVPAVEISVDDAALPVARTRLEIAFEPSATIGGVNGVLAALGANLVSMLEGVLVLTVRIPDPGTVTALDGIVAGLQANPLVRYVNRGTFLTTSLLPTNYPPASTDLPKLDHNLAVRAHAAWNVRPALAAGTLPLVVVTDFYGGGLPNADTDRVDVAGSVGNGASDAHGYHVLGTIAATFDGPVSSRGLATGMFPAASRVAYVDFVVDATTRLTTPEAQNRTIAIARAENGNVVLNTSLQFKCETAAEVAANCNAANANLQGVTWVEKVRGTVGGPASLEGKILNLAAGGNVTVAGDLDASVGSPYAAARLLPLTAPGMLGGPVANLTNTLVVENVINSPTLPFRPTCLNQSSKRPGDLAGIGTDVFSLTDASATAGDLTGTSMATPQVAGLAAYVWALQPSLTPQAVGEILLATARPDAQLIGDPRCDATLPSAVIDAYAAVLAVDDGGALAGSGQAALAPVRLALLDVADGAGAAGSNGAFDEQDVQMFLAELDAAAGAIDHSRFDLNGDAATGGSTTDRFDLTIDPSPTYGTHTKPILNQQITFDEAAVTDFEVLCFYAFSPLYTGDTGIRDDLLPECAPEPCPQVRTGGRISVGELPECTINFGQTSEVPLPFSFFDRECEIGGLTFTHSADVTSSINAGTVDLSARRETTGTATVFFQSIAAGDSGVDETITIDAPGMTGQQGTATPTVTIDGTMNASGACNNGGSSAQWTLRGAANGTFTFDASTDRAAIGCGISSFTGPAILVGEAFTFTYGEPFTFSLRFDAQARAEGGTGAPHQAATALTWTWDGLAGLAPGATVESCSGVNWAVPAAP
jgi:hypothetical protein